MVKDKILEKIAEVSDADVAAVTDETKFSELGIDSLDMTEIAMELEDEFNITLQMSPELNTVGKLVAEIEKLMNEA